MLSAKEGSSVFDLIKLDLTGPGSTAGSAVVGGIKKATVLIQLFRDFEGETGMRLSLKCLRGVLFLSALPCDVLVLNDTCL